MSRSVEQSLEGINKSLEVLARQASMSNHSTNRSSDTSQLFQILGETEVVLDYYNPPLKGKGYILDAKDGLRISILFSSDGNPTVDLAAIVDALNDSHLEMSVMRS